MKFPRRSRDFSVGECSASLVGHCVKLRWFFPSRWIVSRAVTLLPWQHLMMSGCHKHWSMGGEPSLWGALSWARRHLRLHSMPSSRGGEPQRIRYLDLVVISCVGLCVFRRTRAVDPSWCQGSRRAGWRLPPGHVWRPFDLASLLPHPILPVPRSSSDTVSTTPQGA